MSVIINQYLVIDARSDNRFLLIGDPNVGHHLLQTVTDGIPGDNIGNSYRFILSLLTQSSDGPELTSAELFSI